MDRKYDDPSNLFLKGFKYDISKKKDEEKSKSQPEETERVKLRRQKVDDKYWSECDEAEVTSKIWWSKGRKRFKNFKSKQIINWNSNIISINKSWREFIWIKQWNQANIISFVSA